MASEIERVLSFWIDEVGPDGWYEVSPELDARITKEFGELWQRAIAGELTRWTYCAKGSLALLILLDQFSRNIHRGTGEAFAADRVACRIAKQAIGQGHDKMIAEPQRQFFYLPLMHSEVLADQEACVRQIMLKMPKDGAENLPHAVNHREVIRKFGRFPSRNAALGREDSDAELAYRADGGYMS
ncbi:MAG: DUF924 family protein [Pseudomonadota bacterium]